MANGGLLGYALGMPEHHRERKEMLSDEDRQLHVSDLYPVGRLPYIEGEPSGSLGETR
jgi:hypothetical protein